MQFFYELQFGIKDLVNLFDLKVEPEGSKGFAIPCSLPLKSYEVHTECTLNWFSKK